MATTHSDVHHGAPLFPTPKHQSAHVDGALSNLSPIVWPGVTQASTETLRRLLTKNWDEHHVFFNNMGFHNHIIHHLLTIWSMGAPPSVMEDAYAHEAVYQRKPVQPPNEINKENWRDHLGDERYYQAYRAFFLSELDHQGAGDLLEEYVFSREANIGSAADGPHPEMLVRFVEGLIHPMIHTGFGIEFGLSGIIAEGLAQTAVHGATLRPLIPLDWFKSTPNAPVADSKERIHAFSILSRILADPSLKLRPKDPNQPFFADAMKLRGDAIRAHIEPWGNALEQLNGDTEQLKQKTIELVWINSLLYAVGGEQEGSDFNADFFLMHLVTSSLFLPTITSVLKPSSRILLLKAYLSISLMWYISRGRPQLDLARFFQGNNQSPIPQPSQLTQNPWLSIIQKAIIHPDDHFPKLQRALATWDMCLGSTEKGTFVTSTDSGTSDHGIGGKGRRQGIPVELKGAEEIDGSLFLRAASLSVAQLDVLSRDGASNERGNWSRKGFYGV